MILLHDESPAAAFPGGNVIDELDLSMIVNICWGEKLFSKLALIKNNLKTIITLESLKWSVLTRCQNMFSR